jgi:hypothetical protein
MSWLIQAVGKPEALKRRIAQAIEGYPTAPHNQSRREFEEAQPYLNGLLDLTMGATLVRLEASGSASFDSEGKKVNGSCKVAIEPLYDYVE